MPIHRTLHEVTERIRRRSAPTRERYLKRISLAAAREAVRGNLGCANLAHGFAAAPARDKIMLKEVRAPNIGIVTAYNDMLSAHQPYGEYPPLLKEAARGIGATAQVAGGVPAMCDGVTQGRLGMELSLFSRDVIALATSIALSHDMFDAALYLGICDKIVPGLLIGALRFGHLPAVFVPSGPMTSGLSNPDKAKVRQRYVAGEIPKSALLEAESQAYHAPGTCTFYGTANSNQMLIEIMGLHLPGAAFENPGTDLRRALTVAAVQRAAAITALGKEYIPVANIVDERAIANAIVGLVATGGSTNHTLHLVAVARAAGIRIDWNDFDDLSAVVPTLTRVYPNGVADVNHFHAAGGVPFVIRELLDTGLLHEDVQTIMGPGLRRYAEMPALDGAGTLGWTPVRQESGDPNVVATAAKPFSADGGLKLLSGNLGRAMIKVSAVKSEHRVVEAPARVFESQQALIAAAKAGELDRDVVAIVRFQGPRANGMPELHQLTPTLANIQDKGFKVALVTDGRMSGASGKVPAAIHVTPEACAGGALARVRDGDVVRLDSVHGVLDVKVSATEFDGRTPVSFDPGESAWGLGRELFAGFRASVSGAEAGAVSFPVED